MSIVNKLPLVSLRSALVGLGLLFATPSWAVDCDAIMNMVNVNVPVATVVATMQGSGRTYTPADVRCLQSKGAPAEVIAAGVWATLRRISRLAPSRLHQDKKVAGPRRRCAPRRPLEEMDEGGGPAIIEELIANYRAQKYLTASKGLYDIFRDDTYPEHRTKVAYYLAKSLYDMGMYHGAQRYFLEVVRGGPSNPYFKYALPRLVAIAKHTGNDAELLRFVDKVPPESFPRQAKNTSTT